MNTLVCGGRDFTDKELAFRALDMHHRVWPITELIHGGARGADTLAGEWAAARDIPVKVFPADWDTHGTAAGRIRNAQMLREGKPFVVLAFPGGRGTADMVGRACYAPDVDVLKWTGATWDFVEKRV